MALATRTAGGKGQLAFVDLATSHVMNAVSRPSVQLVG
jgi:hypothetical protein